eukprot:TCONS_00042193-protein
MRSLSLYMCANKSATIGDFWSWLKTQGSNLQYFANMILTYLFSLMFYRVSVRRNYCEGVLFAMEKLSTLFFVRNHPIYQKIVHYNRLVMAQMPFEVKEVLKPAFCTSTTGNVDSCQGGDAVLEEINKKIKRWLSNVGVPSGTSWIETIRSLDNLEQLCGNFLSSFSHHNIAKHVHAISDKEIIFMRVVLRESEYLS